MSGSYGHNARLRASGLSRLVIGLQISRSHFCCHFTSRYWAVWQVEGIPDGPPQFNPSILYRLSYLESWGRWTISHLTVGERQDTVVFGQSITVHSPESICVWGWVGVEAQCRSAMKSFQLCRIPQRVAQRTERMFNKSIDFPKMFFLRAHVIVHCEKLNRTKTMKCIASTAIEIIWIVSSPDHCLHWNLKKKTKRWHLDSAIVITALCSL